MTITAKAETFATRHRTTTDEKQDDQNFIRDFVGIFTDTDPADVFRFQYPVPTAKNTTGFIDALWEGHIGIEVKSTGKNLDTTLAGQVRDYIAYLPGGVQPQLWIVTDFQHFLVVDPDGKQHRFPLAELPAHLPLFTPIFDGLPHYLRSNGTVNERAAKLLADVLNGLKGTYPEEHLPVLATRLLFCLYADDNYIWQPGAFHTEVLETRADGSNLGRRINAVFATLDDKADAEASEYRYINGAVFRDRIPAATFDGATRSALIAACEYDWSGLDPLIFGKIYESAMNADDRHAEGAHYTHESDILDILNPALLNGLRERFEGVKHDPRMVEVFLHDLAQVDVLDPACGSGNFLLVAYRELRALETAAILAVKAATGRNLPSRVSLSQMHGIEYNELSAAIAKSSLWLALHAADQRHADATGELAVGTFPLHQQADIRHGNAAVCDWAVEFPGMTVIVGNPPYISADMQDDRMRAERKQLHGISGGKMDYAHVWMVQAAKYLAVHPSAMVGYVITAAVAAGTQAKGLWSHPAMQGVYVTFGRQSYVWPGDAAVRVVNIGLGVKPEAVELRSEGGAVVAAEYLTPYLTPAPAPTCGVAATVRSAPPWMVQLKAGGSYYDGDKKANEYPYSRLSDTDLAALRKDHPEMLIRKVSAVNLLNGTDDWVLWWEDATPEARKHPVIKRLRARAADIRSRGRSLAGVPELERAEWFPRNCTVDGATMVVPRTFSKEYVVTPVTVINGRHYITDKGYFAPLDWFMVGLVMSRQAMEMQLAMGSKMASGNIQYGTGYLYGMPAPKHDSPDLRARIAAKARECVEARPGPAADCMKRSNMPVGLVRLHAELDALVGEWWG
jgi:hypothetical protein